MDTHIGCINIMQCLLHSNLTFILLSSFFTNAVSYVHFASSISLVLKYVFSCVQDMFEEKRSILEPAGALALAGAEAYCKYYNLKGETVVAITSGANMNFDRLRLVTELADVGRKREAVLATFLPEQQGSFKKFTELVCHMR
jgi:threonine dehydratase